MTFEAALRATEIMMALALIQHSAEHLAGPRSERPLFAVRIALCALVALGLWTQWALLGLFLVGITILHRFQGPYNGGSDRMGLLILTCLLLAHFAPTPVLRETAFGYLGVQLVLSYFISGQVKIVNPEWRSGRALQDVFRFSAYPVSGEMRRLADRPRLLWTMSWAVMLFEVIFPLLLVQRELLIGGLILAVLFHLSNACFFGLNRFFWIWISAYPSILWLQARLLGAL